METLIRNIYRDVLMRTPTNAELSAGLSALNGGQTTESFISGLVNSPESVNIVQPVAGIYGALFGRTPDKDGLTFWVFQHRSVQSLNVPDNTDSNGNPLFDSTYGREALISTLKLMVNPDLTAEFSSKYDKGIPTGRFYQANDLVTDTLTAAQIGATGTPISQGPTALDFVNGLYQNILGRTPDVGGRDFWISVFNAQVARATEAGSLNPWNDARAFVVDRFVDGSEFKTNIGSYLVQFLNGAGLDPDPANHYADPNNLENAGSLGNDAPNLVTVAGSVAENSAAGTEVVTLNVIDRDFNDTASFSLVDPSGKFTISGDKIVVAQGANIDFETQNSYVVTVTATDAGPTGGVGLSDTESITISITDVVENLAPTLVTTSGSVVENATAGTRVATLVSTDPDAGDSAVYSIANDPSGLFEINGNELSVKAGANIDFETAGSHVVSITVTDGGGLSDTKNLTITVADVNEAPRINPVTGSVNENATAGTTVAVIDVIDPDSADGTLELTDASGFFEIDDDEIVVRSGAKIDFEDTRVFVVQVTATDSGGLSASRNVTINVNDVNEAPTVAATSGSVLENSSAGTVVASITATDPDDGDDAPVLALADSSGNFALSGSNIVVRAGASLDFETQSTYEVFVRATDENDPFLNSTRSVTISVLDANENVAPVLSLSQGTVVENSAAGTSIVTLQSSDGNPGDSAVYSITDTSGLFQVNGNQVVVRAGANINFESAASHTIGVTVTDAGGLTDTGQLTINVVNLNEAPVLATSSGSVAENSAAGTTVSSFSVSDPDADDTVTLSLTDASGLFEISSTNNIVVKNGANIDFETATSHTVTVVATDSGGLTASNQVTIAVTDVVEAQTIVLTSNADTPSTNSAGANTLGGDGPDRYEGLLRASDSNSTMNSNDVLNGGAGFDTLDVRIIDTPTNDRVVEISSQSVEKIVFRLQPGDENAFATVDLTTADDVEELWVLNSPGNSGSGGNVFLQVDNLNPNDLDFIALENVQGNVFVALTGQGGRNNSTDDAIKLLLNGAKNETLPISFLLNDDSGQTDTTFEILNIESVTSSSQVDLFNIMGFTDVVVTGDAHLLLTDFGISSSGNNFVDLKNIDASSMTGGGLAINAKGATATDLSYKGSDFDDFLVLSKNNGINANNNTVSLDGGDGKDSLFVESFNFNGTSVALATINDATSIEVLGAFESATSLDVSVFDTIKEFVFAGSTSSSRVNVTEIEDDNLIVFAADQKSGNSPVIRFSGEGAGTELFFELRSDANEGGTEIIKTQGSSGSDEAAIDFRNISSVNIASTGDGDEANVINAVRSTSNDRFAFDNTNITNFDITGTQDLVIGAVVGESKGQNRDVRGFENAVNVDASSFEGNLRIAGSNSNSGDRIEGGLGDDIIYGIGDDDELTGNAGADQFRFSSFNDEDNEVTDFMIGEDKIGFVGEEGSTQFLAAFNNTTATAEGTELSSSDYVENRFQISQMGSSDTGKLVELREALSQSQIQSDTTNSSVDALVLVFNSDTNKAEIWVDLDWSDSNSRSKVMTFDNIETLAEMIGLSNTDFVEYLF